MLPLTNNSHSTVPRSQQDRVESFHLFLNWFYPKKIIISKNRRDSINFHELFDGIIQGKFYFKEKSLKEILSFLSLVFEGVGSLMHYLVLCKHFSPYNSISSNIKYIEEKCEQELPIEEKEHYLFVKNSEGLTYKELDQKLQDEKIKSIAFNALQQNLQNAMDVSDRNHEIPYNAEVMVNLCKKGQIDSDILLQYRADRTDDGDSPLFFKGDTLLSIAVRLYLRGQLAPDFIYRLLSIAFSYRIYGGNHFLKASNINKIIKSDEEKQRLLSVNKMAPHQFALKLINTLCQKNIDKVEIFTNLPLLLKIQIKDEGFFHSFIRKFWEECLTVKPEAFGNASKLLVALKNCANSKWSPFSKICQSILEHKNKDGKTLETLYCKLARAAASLHPERFLSIFFSCSEVIDEVLFFDFRIHRTPTLILGVPTYAGDTLLHIAARLYASNKIKEDFLEKMIDKAIFATSDDGRIFLDGRNRADRRYTNILFKNLKITTFLQSCLIKSLRKLLYNLISCPFEEIKDILLRNLDMINNHLFGLSLTHRHELVDRVFRLAEKKQNERNIFQLTQLLKEQVEKNTKYAEQSKKFLEFKNAKGITFLCYGETQQHLNSGDKIRLSGWESLLITSFTEEARELLAISEDREIILANLMKKAQETRNQKILHEPNSLVEAKFIKKLNNSIKKIFY